MDKLNLAAPWVPSPLALAFYLPCHDRTAPSYNPRLTLSCGDGEAGATSHQGLSSGQLERIRQEGQSTR